MDELIVRATEIAAALEDGYNKRSPTWSDKGPAAEVIRQLVQQIQMLTIELDFAEERAVENNHRASAIVATVHRTLDEVGAMKRCDHPDPEERAGRDGRGTFMWRIRQLAKDRRINS